MIISAMILALLQAFAEFLPISSSGHLVLAEDILKLSPQVFNLSFDIMLHFGSLLALLVYFRKELFSIVKGVARKEGQSTKLLINILVATIPVIVVGYFLGDYIENSFRGIEAVIFNLVFFGVIFLIAEKIANMKKDVQSLRTGQSFLIGCAQTIALIPGVSRSGITIIAGILFGLKRDESAHFAFLVAIPSITLASIKGLTDILNTKEVVYAYDIYLTGLIVSFIASLFVINFFLKYIKSHSLRPFIYYRFALALTLISFIIL